MDQERIVEYEKAQDSAEHYDTMIWTVISIGIGFSLIILYKVWTEIEVDSNIKVILLFIGAMALSYFSNLIESADQKKKLKYQICKKIERENNFIGQHIKVSELPLSDLGWNGLRFLRTFKLILFLSYLISMIIFGLTNYGNTKNWLNLIGPLFGSIAVIFAILTEIFVYYRKNLNNGTEFQFQ